MNGVMLVLLDPLGGSRAPYDHALAWSKAWCGNRGGGASRPAPGEAGRPDTHFKKITKFKVPGEGRNPVDIVYRYYDAPSEDPLPKTPCP